MRRELKGEIIVIVYYKKENKYSKKYLYKSETDLNAINKLHYTFFRMIID